MHLLPFAGDPEQKLFSVRMTGYKDNAWPLHDLQISLPGANPKIYDRKWSCTRTKEVTMENGWKNHDTILCTWGGQGNVQTCTNITHKDNALRFWTPQLLIFSVDSVEKWTQRTTGRSFILKWFSVNSSSQTTMQANGTSNSVIFP